LNTVIKEEIRAKVVLEEQK